MRKPKLVIAACLAALTLVPDQSRAQAAANALAGQVGFDQQLGAQVPLDLRFRAEDGREIPLREFAGKKPFILALVYYRCPLLCNQVLNSLTSTLKVIPEIAGKEFDVIAVSIDPAETAELAGTKKRAYLERYGRSGTERGWHFLVGDQGPIDELCRTVGFRYQYNPQTKLFAHAAGIVIATPEGRVSRYFFGIEYPPKEVSRELSQAAAGKIGSPISRLLLFCYDYDAATGKYTLAIVRIMRVLGTLTAVSLGTYLLVMFRRERRAFLLEKDPRDFAPHGSSAEPGTTF